MGSSGYQRIAWELLRIFPLTLLIRLIRSTTSSILVKHTVLLRTRHLQRLQLHKPNEHETRISTAAESQGAFSSNQRQLCFVCRIPYFGVGQVIDIIVTKDPL